MRLLKFAIFILLSMCFAPASAKACESESLASSLDDARLALMRAAGATDLSSARLQAGRARRSLGDASDSMEDCDCSNAASDIEAARRYLSDAEARPDLTGFLDLTNSAIRRFNSAVSTIDADDCS